MVRLAAKPSLWMNFIGRLLFGIVWAGAAFGMTWLVWPHRAETPVFIDFILGLFDLLALGIVWDLVVRLFRTVTNKQPILDIDHDDLQFGSTAQVHFTEPHPESLAEIDVRLVAQHRVVTKNGGTTIISSETCYDQELLRMNVEGVDPVSRVLQIEIPPEPPADDAKWMIVVNTKLRQGGIMPHSYPINVRNPRPSS